MWIVFGLPLIFAQWVWFRTKWNPDFILSVISRAMPKILLAVLFMLLAVLFIVFSPLVQSFRNKSEKSKSGQDNKKKKMPPVEETY